MWQDAFVTVIAFAAVGVLGWRWFRTRKRPSGACASCSSGTPCAPHTQEPAPGITAPDVKPLTFFRN